MTFKKVAFLAVREKHRMTFFFCFQLMGFGAHGPCGRRVRRVAVRGLGRGSDHAIVLLLNLAASLAVAPRDK